MIIDADTTLQAIKKKSVIGVITLTSRTALLQIIALSGNFFLTILLLPETYGVFFVVSAIVSFLNYFSDVGLAASLIQKHAAITEDDLSSTFFIQQGIVLTITLLVLLLSSSIAHFYGLTTDGLWLLRALIAAFLLSSLKTIPSVILERKLDFNKLVIPQIIEVLSFNGVAVLFAWKGAGITSFTYAVLARSILGLVSIYLLVPWVPKLRFDKRVAKKLLSFGIPFQMNSFLALAKDDLFTLFLGKLLPFSAIGYIGWAKRWSEAPLRLIMDSIIKVTFPAYSRLQQHPEKLAKAVNKSIFFLSFFIVPMAVGMMLIIRPLVFIIPKYIKWEPALSSFYLFVISSGIAGISTPLINALNAIGRIKITLKFMVIWTILTWTAIPPLVALFNYNGVAVGSVLIGATVVLVVKSCRRYVQFSLADNIFPAVVSSLAMIIAVVILQRILINSIGGIVIQLSVAAVVYVCTFLLFFKDKLLGEGREIMNIIRT